jgi:putative endopeptidase
MFHCKLSQNGCAMRTCLTLMLCLVLAGCNAQPPAKPVASGVDLAGMDKSVNPGDDFDEYTNGGWMKATTIPADKPSYGVFTALADETRKRNQMVIQEAAGSANAGLDLQKIGNFYSSFMDEAGIESKGISPLKTELDAISAIKDKQALARAIGASLRADVDPLNNTNFQTENLFGLWITQSLTDPDRSVPYLLQGGIGLPDRDYYVSDKPEMADLRKQYQAHVTEILKLAGFADAADRANKIFALEKKIAMAHATRVESEDVHSAVTWKREELASKAPGLDWPVLLEAAGLKEVPEFIVWHPKAVPGLAALAASEPIDTWKAWLAYHAIEQVSNFLPKAFVDEHFNFFGKALNGIPEQRPRWQRGVDFTNFALGDAVGKIYVEHYFPPDAKAKIQALTDNLLKAFAKRIDALSWMSPETKAKAKEKVATLKIGVGYPDKWIDYSGLEIVKGDAMGNLQRAELFEYHRQLGKLGKPVDRSEWWMTPQTVNAVNLPLQNALNFPAAILQPPFFDPAADAAHNYGSIGAVIGHEISHSFDDQGSQFDAQGRMVNWWTKDDFDHFKASGEALAAQYDQYKPFPDLAVNGHQTLSENIADLAGLAAAYDAYRLSLGGAQAAVVEGMTPDQRFFISFGQSWRDKTRDAALRNRILTDGHAPDRYRAFTVRNLDSWYDAFEVKPGAKLYLDSKDRVRVW